MAARVPILCPSQARTSQTHVSPGGPCALPQGRPGPGATHPPLEPGAHALSCPFGGPEQSSAAGPPQAPAPPPPEQQAEASPQCLSSPAAAQSVPRSNAAEGRRWGKEGQRRPHPIPQHGDPGLAGEGTGVPWAIWGSRTVGRTRKEKGLSLGEEKDASCLTRGGKPNA